MSGSSGDPPPAQPSIRHEICVAGAGSIGVAWAAVYAMAGLPVRVFDTDPARLAAADQELRAILVDLENHDLLTETVESVRERITWTCELTAAASRATYVQECAPERRDVKIALFEDLAGICGPDTIFASSSSAIPISAVVGEGELATRSLVVHPLNPPYLLRVVEIVPSILTHPGIVAQVAALQRQVGMAPLTLGREIEGFLFNRLQGALLREAYCLVRDGVASVDDIDRAIVEGLGRRWSVIGAFETVDLNTRGGIAAHAERMGPAYARMGAERGQNDPWTPDLVAKVVEQRRTRLPLVNWPDRVRWRDLALMRLARMRKTESGS